MGESTWYNITHNMYKAVYKGYMTKSKRQRNKKEVRSIWENKENFCIETLKELINKTYKVGKYRHFYLLDKKKKRNISVLSFKDRCVQNDIKNAILPLILKYITDDMLGGLPNKGVLALNPRYSVVRRMRKIMNNYNLKYYLLGDISKFYDSIDNVISMRLIEKYISDKNTLNIIKQHLMNLKKLAIGDPFSHLIANMNMAIIIRKIKNKYKKDIILINFADDFIAFSKDKEILKSLYKDIKTWAKQIRLKYKRMYILPIKKDITFCGYKFGRGYVKLTNRTKKRYIKSRHKKMSLGSYKGILLIADTKNLRNLIENYDNKHMGEKIRRPFAGKSFKIPLLEGKKHTIVDFEKKPSREKNSEYYFHILALSDELGLIVYSTGSSKICKYLDSITKDDIPIKDIIIKKDWSGFYYEGTVYTDLEEEEIIRNKFNIPKL